MKPNKNGLHHACVALCVDGAFLYQERIKNPKKSCQNEQGKRKWKGKMICPQRTGKDKGRNSPGKNELKNAR